MAKKSAIFAKFAVDYPDHPKIIGLSDAAFRAHVEMILYSRRYRTDGRIAKRIAKRWPEGALNELMANGETSTSLATDENGDFILHGYDEMQETRAEIEAKSQVNADNGRRGGLAKSQRTAKRTAKHNAKRTASESLSENVAEEEEEEDNKSENSDDPNIGILCDYLADQMERNGSKRPTIGKSWRTAARLMLANDGRTPKQVTNIIDWCQSDPFWKANILSMQKLREKFDTLRLQSERTNITAIKPKPKPGLYDEAYGF